MMSVALQRLPDWPERLVAFFAEREEAPFAWGTNDCITFAAAVVHAITGRQLLEGLQPWNDEGSAAQRLAEAQGMVAAIRSRLGPPLPTPRLAQRGDVLLVRAQREGKRVRFVAVCDADRWAGPHRGGLGRGAMAQACMAWGIGHA
jgi:hypothetical protein